MDVRLKGARRTKKSNAIEKGKHYGWPYCFDLSSPSPEFKIVLQAGPYKNFCNNTAAYKPPYSLLPPHGAPLGMLYYHGSKFPELDGKLLVGLHGTARQEAVFSSTTWTLAASRR